MHVRVHVDMCHMLSLTSVFTMRGTKVYINTNHNVLQKQVEYVFIFMYGYEGSTKCFKEFNHLHLF